jgi:phosphomannomutase/phosphoglucomutase
MDYNILRENDIRGSYPTQINREVTERIGKAYAYYLKSINVDTCLIGHDNRLSSDELNEALINALINSGIKVKDIGLVTTPMFNYASIENEIPNGIMITASHNKASDNGFKIFGENYLHIRQTEIKKLYEFIKTEAEVSGVGSLEKIDIKQSYIKMLIDKFKRINKRVVIDCGNGAACTVVKEIFSKIFLDVSFINCESDGSFPIHNPDPNVDENLKWLKDIVKLKKADLGIAVDGDCDRVGIVDEAGNTITTDYLIAIFARYITPYYQNKNVIIDVKCSNAISEEIKKYGGNPIMVKNGSAYIESVVFDTPALIGGEYSGHIFFRDDYYGYDDGFYAGLRFAQILDKLGVKASDLIKEMKTLKNTPEIRVEVGDDRKYEIIDKIKEYVKEKGYKCSFIDGVRVEYPDGFALVRCSNTGPYITMRFEAATDEELLDRKNEFLIFI